MYFVPCLVRSKSLLESKPPYFQLNGVYESESPA